MLVTVLESCLDNHHRLPDEEVMSMDIPHRFQWGLYKSLQFMNSKRMDFEIRAVFLNQLLAYEGRLFA